MFNRCESAIVNREPVSSHVHLTSYTIHLHISNHESSIINHCVVHLGNLVPLCHTEQSEVTRRVPIKDLLQLIYVASLRDASCVGMTKQWKAAIGQQSMTRKFVHHTSYTVHLVTPCS